MEQSDLRNQVNDLATMLQHPRVFITNYFEQLMNRVDLETSKFIESNNVSIERVLEWNVTMITKLRESESERLANIKKSFKFEPKLQTEIQTVIDRFQNQYDQSIELKDLVYISSINAERVLLGNKSFLVLENEFLQHLKIKSDSPNCTVICINGDVIRQNDLAHLSVMSRKERSFYMNDSYTTQVNNNQKIKRNKLWKETFKISILQNQIDSLRIIKKNSIPCFQLNRTSNVDLYDLNLTDIDEKIFQGFNSIESINLNKNYLLAIPERLFQGLTNLCEIDLSCNHLQSLKSNTFQNLRYLSDIDLSYNQIQTIEPTLFNNLPNLTRLNLGYNQLVSFDPYTFAGLSKLKWLTLFHNKLFSLDESVFKSLIDLIELDLSNNELFTIPSEIFKNLVNIKHVDLRCNSKEVATIEKTYFTRIKAETTILI